MGPICSFLGMLEREFPLDGVVAMANLDMIGRLRDDALLVHGVGTSPRWRPLLEEANRDVGLRLRMREGGFGMSDHASFLAARKPVLFLFTGLHRDYHRPSDTADKVDVAGVSRVVAFAELCRLRDRWRGP